MKPNDYLAWALTKDRSPAQYKELTDRLASNPALLQSLHAAIGISGEAGELIDAVKKSAMYGKPLDVENVKEELGDICWYMALMLKSIGSSFEEVMGLNNSKLEARYPSGFSEKAAQVRADKVPPLPTELEAQIEKIKRNMGEAGKKPKTVSVFVDARNCGLKINAIKVIRNETGCGLKEAADFVRSEKPVKIYRGTFSKGVELAAQLKMLGCFVEVR